MGQIKDPPAGRRTLSLDRIIDAAIDLAHRDGVVGMSMRKLADDLDVQAMSLYHHLPNKASLMTLMAQRTVSKMTLSDDGCAWDEQLIDLLVNTYRAAATNPVLLSVLAAEAHDLGALPASGTGAAALPLLERVVELLQQGRVPLQMQVDAFRGLIGITVGFITTHVNGALTTTGAAGRSTVGEEHRTADTVPLLGALGPALAVADPTHALRSTLHVYLAGLRQLVEADHNIELRR